MLKELISVDNVSLARDALRNQGVIFFDQVYSNKFCSEIIDFIDNYTEEDAEINYGGTEKRIWFAENKNPLIKTFYEHAGRLLSEITRVNYEPIKVLAYSNKALGENQGEHYEGRWHIDSFLPMYKVFIFLTDTTEKSGPFEFLPGTHKKTFRYKMLMKNGIFFDWLAMLRCEKSRPYQSLPETEISKLQESGYTTKPAIVKAGTVMVVNTSAIHRARPCIEGERYALTAYFGHSGKL